MKRREFLQRTAGALAVATAWPLLPVAAPAAVASTTLSAAAAGAPTTVTVRGYGSLLTVGTVLEMDGEIYTITKVVP